MDLNKQMYQELMRTGTITKEHGKVYKYKHRQSNIKYIGAENAFTDLPIDRTKIIQGYAIDHKNKEIVNFIKK